MNVNQLLLSANPALGQWAYEWPLWQGWGLKWALDHKWPKM